MEERREHQCACTMNDFRRTLITHTRHATETAIMMVLVCALSPTLSAQAASDAETAVRALEKQWAYAQGHNDNRALDLIFDNGMVYVEYSKLVSKGEYLARIRRQAPSSDEIVMDPLTLHCFENTVIVIGSYREKQLQRGQREIRRWRFIDTWVYKKNGWALVAAAATPLK